MSVPVPARLVDLGVRPYGDVWRMQQEWVAARQRDEIPDTLILVEHPHVITLGRRARQENLIDTSGVDVFTIERGGDVTYHGPGQLVGYPIFLLRDGERDLHRYLRNMEEAIIRTVGEFGITGTRRDGWTGVWTSATPHQRKLASIGVAVKKWVTMHGFALNVSTDLARFAAINPCGLDAHVMTSMDVCLGRRVDPIGVASSITRHFSEVFGRIFAIARAP